MAEKTFGISKHDFCRFWNIYMFCCIYQKEMCLFCFLLLFCLLLFCLLLFCLLLLCLLLFCLLLFCLLLFCLLLLLLLLLLLFTMFRKYGIGCWIWFWSISLIRVPDRNPRCRWNSGIVGSPPRTYGASQKYGNFKVFKHKSHWISGGSQLWNMPIDVLYTPYSSWMAKIIGLSF